MRTFEMTRVLALLLATGVATAAPAALEAETRDGFAQAAARVRTAMQPGGRYAYVHPEERAAVEAGLDRMAAQFAHADRVAAMAPDAKLDLFNAQERVNAILEQRDGERLVCERNAPTGSRIVSTRCRTYGQIEADQDASRKLMNEKLAAPCQGASCLDK